jgi:tRNA dimethylallyltransferase
MCALDMSSGKPPLAVIAGPTASGKSALAVAMARARNGVIVNADASQVYADLRLLSARPSAAEEALAPHRLYGIIDGREACTAARWAGLAKAEIEAAWAAGRLPILVGGTGLYLRTLLEGISPVPPVAAAVRAAVRALDAPAVRAALVAEDPAMAAWLHPNDRQRNARALEVWRATGRSLGDWQAQTTGGIGAVVALDAQVVSLPRGTLYARCDARASAMLELGAVDEVAALVARRLPADAPVMKALGVRPIALLLAGEIDRAQALAALQQETRNYAKRQQTWFANQTGDWPRISPI